MGFVIFVSPALVLAELSGLALGGQDTNVPTSQRTTAQVATVAAAAQPQGKVTDEVEREIKARLSAAMQSSEVFRGAWIEVVVPESRDRIQIVPILDAGQLKEQQQALEALLKKAVTTVKYDLKPAKTRPISKYLAEVQSRIDVDLALGGCLITGAYYKPPAAGSTAQELMLLGRVADPKQNALILEWCVEVQQLPEYRGPLQETLPKPDEMKVVAPSERVGAYMFNSGVNNFIAKDYDAAHRAFSRSILESPRRLEYRYWQIVTEIAQGNEEHAYTHLKPLVDLRRQGSGRYSEVLDSLERVQGPIRQCLHKLEKRAFFE